MLRLSVVTFWYLAALGLLPLASVAWLDAPAWIWVPVWVTALVFATIHIISSAGHEFIEQLGTTLAKR